MDIREFRTNYERKIEKTNSQLAGFRFYVSGEINNFFHFGINTTHGTPFKVELRVANDVIWMYPPSTVKKNIMYLFIAFDFAISLAKEMNYSKIHLEDYIGDGGAPRIWSDSNYDDFIAIASLMGFSMESDRNHRTVMVDKVHNLFPAVISIHQALEEIEEIKPTFDFDFVSFSEYCRNYPNNFLAILFVWDGTSNSIRFVYKEDTYFLVHNVLEAQKIDIYRVKEELIEVLNRISEENRLKNIVEPPSHHLQRLLWSTLIKANLEPVAKQIMEQFIALGYDYEIIEEAAAIVSKKSDGSIFSLKIMNDGYVIELLDKFLVIAMREQDYLWRICGSKEEVNQYLLEIVNNEIKELNQFF